MKDFYGVEYVKSRWTCFKFVEDLIGFTSQRTNALRVWLQNVERHLQAEGVAASLVVVEQPNFAGGNIYGEIHIGGKRVDLSLYHYDTLTKGEINPAAYVVAALRYA